jgi:hypothetical protein
VAIFKQKLLKNPANAGVLILYGGRSDVTRVPIAREVICLL